MFETSLEGSHIGLSSSEVVDHGLEQLVRHQEHTLPYLHQAHQSQMTLVIAITTVHCFPESWCAYDDERQGQILLHSKSYNSSRFKIDIGHFLINLYQQV